MEEQSGNGAKVVGIDGGEVEAVVTTTEHVIELTKRVYFHRGVWAGFVVGACVVGLKSWLFLR